MSSAPQVLSALAAIEGIGLIVLAALVRTLWKGSQSSSLKELSHRLEELVNRQLVLEEKIAKLESARGGGQIRDQGRSGVSRHRRVRTPRDHGDIRIDPGSDQNGIPGPTLIAIPNLSSPQSHLTDEASMELAERFGGIWKLADAGNSPDSIVRETGLPIGQVELILALRRQPTSLSGGRD